MLEHAETEQDPHEIAEIQTRLADIGAYAAPARAAVDPRRASASPPPTRSGPARNSPAAGACASRSPPRLFAEPDLLLLDEPTNYLDLEGTLWLQDHLARYPRTMIVISHDRDLLDTSVEQILSLENQKLTLYRGGYSDFERLRGERLMLDQKMAKKQEAQRKHLQAFVDRFKAKATKARQAQSRVKMLEKMEPIAAVVTERRAADQHSARRTSCCRRRSSRSTTSRSATCRASRCCKGLNMRIDNDDRIALLGSNGNGKSTLVKLIAARLAPLQGTHHPRLDGSKIAYFAQHQLDELDAAGTAYEHVRELMPDAPEAKVRARAGAIGFSGRQRRHARSRSCPAARRRG